MADKEILNSGGFSAMLKELFTKIKNLLSGKLDTTANAVSATKLNTARTIGISGGATGTATSFDGSTNISIPVTSLDASKLSGTASISTTGNAATATTATTTTGNAGSATKLATARTISLSDGAIATATSFDGSANISIPVTSFYESYAKWGGKNYAGDFNPFDAALNSSLGANRLAGINPNGVSAEYSTDNGSTWVDYGASDSNKVALCTTSTTFKLGGPSAAAGNISSSNQLRITLDGIDGGIYTQLYKFHLYMSTNGSSGCTVTIERATYSDSSTFITLLSNQPIAGWSGWNVFNFSTIGGSGSFGGTNNSSHNRKLRFTFKNTACESSYSGLLINSLYAYGGVGWTEPSYLAKYGTPYSYDYAENVTFPSNVTASAFLGNASTATTATTTTGNASTATTLQTARTIALSGGATGTATSFNGSANITIPVTSLDATKLTGTASINTTGNATTATALQSSAGSAKQPVYFLNGKPVATSYELNKTVPSDAKFTDSDTTYTLSSDSTTITLKGSDGSSSAVMGSIGPTGATGAKGDKGDTGATGTAATIAVGTVTTGAAGTSAAVTNAGTSSAAKFNFTIPKGDKGDTGAAGSVGSVVSSGTGNAVTSISVNTSTGVLTYIKGATYAEKDTVTQFAIAVASWSSSPTTVEGTAYYTYTVTLTNVYKPIPSVCIGSSSVLPTADEQTAYNCIKYSTVDADTLTLKLYAESVPTSAFYVKVIGAA